MFDLKKSIIKSESNNKQEILKRKHESEFSFFSVGFEPVRGMASIKRSIHYTARTTCKGFYLVAYEKNSYIFQTF
jgi:hypothetical protein